MIKYWVFVLSLKMQYRSLPISKTLIKPFFYVCFSLLIFNKKKEKLNSFILFLKYDAFPHPKEFYLCFLWLIGIFFPLENDEELSYEGLIHLMKDLAWKDKKKEDFNRIIKISVMTTLLRKIENFECIITTNTVEIFSYLTFSILHTLLFSAYTSISIYL